MVRKLSLKRLKAFAREEKQTAKLYKRLGFKKQGRQESLHAKFFAKKAMGMRTK